MDDSLFVSFLVLFQGCGLNAKMPIYIVKFIILTMNIFYKRESSAQHYSNDHKKRLKHFSYSPEDRIGKGYSSVVYRGINEQTNEIVAVKAIDMKGVRDAVSRQMLDCQIQALTKLRHPNILRCYDVVRQTSHCYIVTEFCNEGDLSSLLKKKRRIPEKEVLQLMKDIVSGFIEMADRKFLHRDLKLANIFLSNGRAVLADFGFAKKHNNIFTKEKYNVGSPLYMSPQALKKNIYTVKNDIWSIGIMIYELLHGETPWECKTEKQLMDKMVKVPVRFTQSVKVSEPLKNFIKKCLQVNEDQRMSLQDLKDWNNTNSYDSLKSGEVVFQTELKLVKQPISSKQSANVLGEVTNRISSRSHSNVASHQFRTNKDTIRQNSSFATNKENKENKDNKSLLPKTIVDKNNNILVLQINKFRLLFKILQKLKKHAVQQHELANTIGNEVLKRVNFLMGVICPDKENVGSNRGQTLGLAQLKNYLSEEGNSGIKKYKSVIKEYHKKYNAEITINALGRPLSTKQIIKETLQTGNLLTQANSSQALVMVYWMSQFLGLQDDVKKEQLDAIIEPNMANISRSRISDKIKAL